MRKINIYRCSRLYTCKCSPIGSQLKSNNFIKVMDLATGHVAAMKKLEKGKLGIKFYNLGSGEGISVMNLIKTFEKVNNVKGKQNFILHLLQPYNTIPKFH